MAVAGLECLALQIAAGRPLRTTDMLGLVGLLVVGVAIIACAPPLSRFLHRNTHGAQLDEAGFGAPVFRFASRAIVVLAGLSVTVLTALVILGIASPRPGTYPGTPLVQALAVAALIAVSGLLLRQARRGS